MKLDIQLFGGRGASSSGNISQLNQKEKSLREQMTKLYKDNGGFARMDKEDVSKAREKWYKLQRQANEIRNKINELEDKKRKKTSSKSKKTFVNSYGEATKREITTSTYKRQQKRKSREIMRRLGK